MKKKSLRILYFLVPVIVIVVLLKTCDLSSRQRPSDCLHYFVNDARNHCREWDRKDWDEAISSFLGCCSDLGSFDPDKEEYQEFNKAVNEWLYEIFRDSICVLKAKDAFVRVKAKYSDEEIETLYKNIEKVNKKYGTKKDNVFLVIVFFHDLKDTIPDKTVPEKKMPEKKVPEEKDQKHFYTA